MHQTILKNELIYVFRANFIANKEITATVIIKTQAISFTFLQFYVNKTVEKSKPSEDFLYF